MKTRKWKRYWFGLGVLVIIQIVLLCFFFGIEKDKDNLHIDGFKLIIETIGSACGLFLALIIFLMSQESSAIQQNKLMKQRETLHSLQIDAILRGNEHQTSVLARLFESQNKTFRETILKEFKKSKKPDEGFEISMRVYDISRIDLKMEELEIQLKDAYRKMSQIKEFQFLRFQDEKAKDIKDQNKKIAKLVDQLTNLKKKREDLSKMNR